MNRSLGQILWILMVIAQRSRARRFTFISFFLCNRVRTERTLDVVNVLVLCRFWARRTLATMSVDGWCALSLNNQPLPLFPPLLSLAARPPHLSSRSFRFLIFLSQSLQYPMPFDQKKKEESVREREREREERSKN